MRAQEFIIEAFDQPYKAKWEKSDYGDYDALVKLPDGTPLSIMFNHEGDDEWQVEFYRNNSQEVTGQGDAQRIFATVLNAIQKFIQKQHPERIRFSATKDDNGDNQSRTKLYDRLVQRYANSWGYSVDVSEYANSTVYELFNDLNESNLEEGWKERIAAAGIGAAMTLGGQQALKQYQPAQPVQPQQQQQQQLTPKQTLIQTAKQAGITGDELAQLLAQAAHETLNFTRMREAGTPEYFTKKYEQHRKTARILGNKVKGDGERYKGRGFVQLTGRDNYTRAGQALGLPLAANPELAAQPEVAAKIAVWYWQNRVAPKVSDFTNTKAVTKKINPALKHQDRRQQQFTKYQLAQYESA